MLRRQFRPRARWRPNAAAAACLIAAVPLVTWCGWGAGFVGVRDVSANLGRHPPGYLHKHCAPPALVRRRAGERLEMGAKLQGSVKKFNPHGAILDVGRGKDAFLHVSEIQEDYLKSAEEVLSLGQNVGVCVIGENSAEIKVSMCKLESKASSDFHVGQEVEGKVVSVGGNMVFLDIGAANDAVLHKDHVGSLDEDLKRAISQGGKVKARVRQLSSKGIRLTMRPLKDLSDFEVGEEVEGKVVGVNRQAVFIDIGAVGDAVLEKEQAGTADEPLKKSFKMGMTVIANVFRTDEQGIKLTMRASVRKANTDFEVGQVVEGRVVGTNQFGLFVDIGALKHAILDSPAYLGQRVSAEICQADAEGIKLTNAIPATAATEE